MSSINSHMAASVGPLHATPVAHVVGRKYRPPLVAHLARLLQARAANLDEAVAYQLELARNGGEAPRTRAAISTPPAEASTSRARQG
jgi:hypothetical protein